jgi:hypothetical protein
LLDSWKRVSFGQRVASSSRQHQLQVGFSTVFFSFHVNVFFSCSQHIVKRPPVQPAMRHPAAGDMDDPVLASRTSQDFFLCLALCHTVRVEEQPVVEALPGSGHVAAVIASASTTEEGGVRLQRRYVSVSPDETALVEIGSFTQVAFSFVCL